MSIGSSNQINLNIPVAHFQNILSWDKATIDRLVSAAIEVVQKDGVPFSSFLFRGLPAGAHHSRNHTQTDELMNKAAEAVKAAGDKGRQASPDAELSEELYGYVREAASELGIEAPVLP